MTLLPPSACWLILFISLSGMLFGQSSSAFEREIQLLKSNESLICEAADRFGKDPSMVLAIGFPQLSRTLSLGSPEYSEELGSHYKYLGSREIDMPIGVFQLKPSFVESLERIVHRYPLVFSPYSFIADYPSDQLYSIREMRLHRLQSLEWQIAYLYTFYSIAEASFQGLPFQGMADKVRFYHTAYRLGFGSKIEDIRQSLITEDQSENLLAAYFLQNIAPVWDCPEGENTIEN